MLTTEQITESILTNRCCFFEQPAWKTTLLSTISKDPLRPERSSVLISLLIILADIPRLFRDLTAAICCISSPPVAILAKLISRAQQVRSSLQAWHSKNFGSHRTPVNGPAFCPGPSQVLVLFYICCIYSNRLSTCIHWAGTLNVLAMEEESQRFANIIISTHNQQRHSTQQGSLLLIQKVPIAQATVDSGADWMEQLSHGEPQGAFFKMPSRPFTNWCRLLGRSIL